MTAATAADIPAMAELELEVSGITRNKREGDGATPAGAWRLMGGGYRADRLQRPLLLSGT